ncbi:MAG: [protein-PII] uridylyltransferase [Thermodesulfobacteriota bacterium]
MNQPAESIHRFLQDKDALVRRGSERGFGVRTTRWYTELADRFVRQLLLDAGFDDSRGKVLGPPFAIAGTGSFGRRELCFGSDIDLTVIHEHDLSQETRKAVARALYPVWDAKLELGYTFFTPEDGFRLLQEEFSVLTSLMDLRLIFGSRELFHSFRRRVLEEMMRDQRGVLDRFLVYQEKREKKYGSVDFFLEPEIKEGLGGLRDLHFMAWISSLFLGTQGFRQIKQLSGFSHFAPSQLIYSKGFLLKIRNHLHLLSGRREDRLLIPHQRDVARTLGYNDRPYSTGPERFMRNVYLHLNRIRYGREQFLIKALDTILPMPPDPDHGRVTGDFRIHKGHLVLDKWSLLEKDPPVLLRAFNEANRLGLSLGSGLTWEAQKKLVYEGKQLAEMPEARKLFLDLILEPRNPKIIRLALEVGLISLFIPEFNRIRNLAQFGYYHVETVDLHSLSTIQILYEISKGKFDDRWPRFKETFDGLENPHWLYLSGLVHDIGKGYRGDHSRKGAQIVPRILERLGVSEEAVKMVSFVVEHHLLLVNTSQRRDLNDEKTAVQTAQTVQNVSLLNHLFLLTVADCFATGPTASSEWKIMLLTELYSKVRRVLERGRLASPDATTALRERKRALYKALIRDHSKKEILALMDQASTRYFLNTPQKDMEQHFRLGLRMGDERIRWSLTKLDSAPVTQVTLCTYDMPGLFSRMVGVFTVNNLQVLSAGISTLKNGLAFDIYRVTNPLDPYREKDLWKKIHRDAVLAIEDGTELEEQFERKRLRELESSKMRVDWIRKVRIDNHATDFFTCIEISAGHRQGFLYRLAKEISALGLDIRFASVYSDRERITGVFHVRDDRGQKIHDASRLHAIRETMLSLIG